ncbi:hypothetical protein ASE74_10045 [Pedobacter sp. Leaf216]|uniref:Crp/Fnr family transcriptional regulator n=1 Tax=Pedobacter sp. Leaf216 TaxID=1735684 RepID=UPI0007001E04|nr:Crp/Fnr family transcriptional regulator [Pedobacter sp. Leaf216]KQM65203.1 hypothetical protein ASE74_10045 [Pedobacter sp. Leaf216]
MERLIDKLLNLRTAEKHLVDCLLDIFVPKVFEKGLLVSTPEYSFPVIYFIEHGLVRGYFVSGQEQHTAWIMESGFFLPSAGFFTGDLSIEYIGFLKESRGFALNLAKADELARKEPRLYRMLLEIYEESLHAGKERELMLRISNAADRYLYFKRHHPKLIYLPIHDILASILNIESKYLYRIKRLYR